MSAIAAVTNYYPTRTSDEISALIAAGHTVTVFTETEAQVAHALDAYDLIWYPLPSSGGESAMATLLRQQSDNGKPILLGIYVSGSGIADPASTVLDDLGLANSVRTSGPEGGYDPGWGWFDRVEIEDNGHIITSGLSLGDLYIQDVGLYDFQGGIYLAGGYVGDLLGTGGTGTWLDEDGPDGKSYGTLVAVESGTVSLTDLPFGNRIVLYGFNYHGNNIFNAAGYALLVDCVEWAVVGVSTSVSLIYPTISVEAIAGQTALVRIDEFFRDDWKIKVLKVSDSSLVYSSATQDGYSFTHQLPVATLQPLTDYVVSGARYRDGEWSDWGGDVEFTTLDNYAPSVPGAWISPEEDEFVNESVSLISDAATDADGDDLTYSTEFSADGGDWEALPGDGLSVVHTLSFSVGTELDYRRRAYDGMEHGPYGDTISITVATSADPVLLYVELTAPGTVVGHTGPYVGEDVHASTRYQVQLEGGDWSGAMDTGYVSGAYLFVSPEFDSLTDNLYEMRFLQRSNLDADTDWCDPVEFTPSFAFESFDGVGPLSGFTNGSYYEVIEVPGTYGGTCVIDTLSAHKLALWTEGGMRGGFKVRFMSHWRMEHQLAPYVPWGVLGHTMSFVAGYDPETGGGYRFSVDYARQGIYITRTTWDGRPVPGGCWWGLRLPPDEWVEITILIGGGPEEKWTHFNCGDGVPILILEEFCSYHPTNIIYMLVKGYPQPWIWQDFGYQVHGDCIWASEIPTYGYSGFQFGLVGEGMRRLDFFGAGGALVTFSPEEDDVDPVALTPEITRPRAGEVFDEDMTLTLPNADTYQVSDDGGETWGSDEAYTTTEIVDVSGWDNGYEYMIRAKRGTSAWAYSQKFSVDHRETPICYHRYFGDEKWVIPPEFMTKLWNTTEENWQIAWQFEPQANPGTALVHSVVNSNASAIRVDSFPLARNGEIRALIRNYHDISGAGVFGRGSGSGAAGEGYWASFVKAWYHNLYRRNAGSDTWLGTLRPFRHGAPMLGALRIVDNILAVKFWVADAREPDEWTTVVEDSGLDDEGYWGLAREGFFYTNYPGCYESVSFVNLDDEEPVPIPGESDLAEKGWAFVLDGHTFYVLNRVDGPAMICDLTTGHWHMWYTNLPPAVLGGDRYWNMWRGIMWKGRVIACDVSDPKIWELNLHSFLDQESLIIPRAVTAFQPLRGSASVRQGSFRITARREVLEHLSIVTMQFSDDAGRTWSHEYEVVMGTGDVSKRIEYRSLGRIRAPGRLWEIRDSGGLVRIEGADTDLEGEEE